MLIEITDHINSISMAAPTKTWVYSFHLETSKHRRWPWKSWNMQFESWDGLGSRVLTSVNTNLHHKRQRPLKFQNVLEHLGSEHGSHTSHSIQTDWKKIISKDTETYRLQIATLQTDWNNMTSSSMNRQVQWHNVPFNRSFQQHLPVPHRTSIIYLLINVFIIFQQQKITTFHQFPPVCPTSAGLRVKRTGSGTTAGTRPAEAKATASTSHGQVCAGQNDRKRIGRLQLLSFSAHPILRWFDGFWWDFAQV